MATEEQSFQQRMGRIESLIEEIERFTDPNAQAIAREIVQSLLDLHGTGLTALLQRILQSGSAGQGLIDELAEDELLSNLFLLYDIHPLDAQARAQRALEKARPYLQSHSGDVELVEITPDGIARTRLLGTCEGCHSSVSTAKMVIEDAILSAAPDVVGVEVEGVKAPAMAESLISLPLLGGKADHPGGWVDLPPLSIQEGEVLAQEVAGVRLIVLRHQQALYAYGQQCPACNGSLESARLDPNLICGHCDHSYDARLAGRSLTDEQIHLEPFPLLVEEQTIRVALPAMTL